MTVSYVCRQCGAEYAEKASRCANCGSLLVKKYSLQQPEPKFRRSVSSEVALLEMAKRAVGLEHAAESLRRRSDAAKEYTIVMETEPPAVPGGLPIEGWIYGSEFDRALRLKADLACKYEGQTLQQAISGESVANSQGECYCITENHLMQFTKPTPEEARLRLISELKLLPGIGAARAQTLKVQGYRTIESLLCHPKWRRQAKEFMALADSGYICGLQQYLRRSLPKSHPLLHYLAGFCQAEDFAIIDIETLGLFGRPIILIGLCEVKDDKVCTRQFLARDVAEEASVLSQLASHLKQNSALVSFNGRCFDVPFMRERMAYYGLDGDVAFGGVHFDVLHFARRVFKDKLSSCRLESIETYMGIGRGVNIPGALVPEFYDFYQRTGNVGPLIAIVEHNKQDLVTLAKLFCSLYKEWAQ